MNIGWSLLVFLIATSACPRKPTIVERPVMIPVACDLPPDIVKPELRFDGVPPCPESHPVCMTADVAALLVIYLNETETWAAEVKALCGEGDPKEDLIPLSPETSPTPP